MNAYNTARICGKSGLGRRIVALQREPTGVIAWVQFNGRTHNYDFSGANAADNDALRLFTWVAF